jgi:hypothetical protein
VRNWYGWLLKYMSESVHWPTSTLYHFRSSQDENELQAADKASVSPIAAPHPLPPTADSPGTILDRTIRLTGLRRLGAQAMAGLASRAAGRSSDGGCPRFTAAQTHGDRVDQSQVTTPYLACFPSITATAAWNAASTPSSVVSSKNASAAGFIGETARSVSRSSRALTIASTPS